MYTQITRCRMCGNPNLTPILNLGVQYLTGVFPRRKEDVLTSGPLELVKCQPDGEHEACGLVQLHHSYESTEMYGQNYGYRSGLNQSMVVHLHRKVARIMELTPLTAGDLIIDIGANDSTLLQAYPADRGLKLVGIDPTGMKFQHFYPPHIQLIPDFFSAAKVREVFGAQRAKIITSIAMFYDLEEPLAFVKQVAESLADDGLWVFEQSYMPSMLEVNAYDTICHEHLEYYGLRQVKWLLDRAGLNIIDVELNNVNGGSFSVMAAKPTAPYTPNAARVQAILDDEERQGLHTLAPYEAFRRRVFEHAAQLKALLAQLKAEGKTILGYGASTKGNVILQFCGLTPADIPYMAEVNKDKFGCFTPGTLIPIISEAEARAMNPDYFLVMPWHFRENLVAREQDYLKRGGKLLFPLPKIDVVSGR